MPFSIKAFVNFCILFMKTFIMPSLEVNHLLILSSEILGRGDLHPIKLSEEKLICGDVLAFSL